MGLAGEAGEAGGVALPDDLVEPCRPLDIRGALLPKGQPYMVEVRAGIQDVLQGGDEQVLEIEGKFLLSYNDDPFVRRLYTYPGIMIQEVTRPNSIKLRYENGAQFPELLIANYDMNERMRATSQIALF